MIRSHDAEPTLAERHALESWFDGPLPDTALSDIRARAPYVYTPTPQLARALRATAKSLRECAMRDLEAITQLLDRRGTSTDEADRVWYMNQAERRSRGYESKMEQAEDYEAEAAEMEKELGR